MKRSLFFTAILASCILLSNCNHTKNLTSQTEALFRDKWKLTELMGSQVPDNAPTSFEFTPGKISGSTGCNRLSANFTAGKHQSIQFTPVASTKMACENEMAGTLENKFIDALSKSTEWSIKDGELSLSDGKNTLVKMRSM